MSLPKNFTARPYRGVSVQSWEGSLDEATVQGRLLGRDAYRRTEFLVLRTPAGTALFHIRKASEEPLMSPIVYLEALAWPEECVYVMAPEVDTGNATQLARAALSLGLNKRAYVIEGLYHHVNFIWEPTPVRIRVLEVIPPEPPKLLEMARHVVGFDEDLPPIDLAFEPIDIRELARAAPARRYLLPCRGSGIDLPASVDFLDERPAERRWTLIGCERSRQLFEWFYGHQPKRVDLCPRQWALGEVAGEAVPKLREMTLLKCCLLERELEHDGERCVVPWGANLKEVQEALHLLVSEPQVPVGA